VGVSSTYSTTSDAEVLGVIRRATRLLDRLYSQGAAVLLAGRVVQLINALALSIVILRRFGLEMVGTFAIGFIALTFVTALSPMGLPSHLPHLHASHSKLSYSALVIQLGAYPFFAVLLYLYARLEGRSSLETTTIFLVALGGLLIGASNTGMMLSIMRGKFYPGLLSPLCESAGILSGAIMAESGCSLAVYLLVGRSLGAISIWSGFDFKSVSIRRLVCIARRGIGYAVPDVLALMSEQCAPLLLSLMVSRPELGLFRLCQQMLTAADTPGWTFVQSKYPDLVQGSSVLRERIYDQVRQLGLAAAALCLVGSSVLAYYVYRLPTLAWMMALVSLTLFWRYKNNYFEQRFRAAGQLAVATTLAVLKLGVSFCASFLLIRAFGAWGAVLALGLLSVVAGITYERVFRRETAEAVVC
jgi:O-antigen/teichoic acid export membrane protein